MYIKFIKKIIVCSLKIRILTKAIFFIHKFFLSNSSGYFGFAEKGYYYHDNESQNKIYFPFIERMFFTYIYSLKKRLMLLESFYNLQYIRIEDNDIIIDCGANIGEIYYYFYLKFPNKKFKYIAFEPDINVFKYLKKNVTNCYQVALFNETSKKKFYLKSETADSSLISFNENDDQNREIEYQVETIKLDDFLKNKKISKVKLFKVEAEGAEPEILQGSLESLDKIEHITVDAGPERGFKKEKTNIDVFRILKNNFKLVDESKNKNREFVYLFTNKKFFKQS